MSPVFSLDLLILQTQKRLNFENYSETGNYSLINLNKPQINV